MDIQSETFAFSADINQLLSLIINTFYSNKDIFLRELISNASDALDKIRYQSLTDSEVLGDEKELRIRLYVDNNHLIIEDTGIGMTKADLINNLGTIAKSGTKTFIEAIKNNADQNLIGQFGVGFYSAFLVADKVIVTSKHNDDVAMTWESEAGGSFNIYPASNFNLKRGTQLTLVLKEDMKQYLTETTIKNLVKKHSEFVGFPIELLIKLTREVDAPVEDNVEEVAPTETVDEETATETVDEETATETVDVETDDESEEVKKEQKKVTEEYTEWEHLNKETPLWTKKQTDITMEQYNSFYKHMYSEWDEPLAMKHFGVEGQLEFKALLFLPKRVPFDMFDNTSTKKKNIKLYVKRVFITDEFTDLMPTYLNFVKGIVDSEDLPLNISREILQHSKILRVIKKNLVKKTLELFKEMAENDTGRYNAFYEQFHINLKQGIHEDENNRDKLIELLRYPSTASGEGLTSLAEYIERMPEDQPGIYYISGESKKIVEASPFIERLKKKNYEVLFLTHPIDEYVVQNLRTWKDKTVFAADKEDLQINETEEEKQQFDNDTQEAENLCTKIKEILGDEIEKVTVSKRVVDSPCILVTANYGWSANMARIMKAQALSDTGNSYMAPRKILEINPTNVIIKALSTHAEKESSTFNNLVWLLYDTSLLTSGFSLEKPTEFAERIHRLIKLGLSIDEEDSSDEADLTATLDEEVSAVEELEELEQVD